MKKIFAMLLGLSVAMAMSICAFGLQEKEAYTENVKNIVTDSVVSVNPVFEGFVSEDILIDEMESISTFAAVDYVSSVEEAGEIIREQLKSRTNPVVVNFVADKYNDQLFYDIIDSAYIHTGNPIDGDYIRFNNIGWKGKVNYYVSGSCYMTFTYTMTYCTTAQQEEEVDEAVDSVLESLDLEGKSQYEKVCAIYDYICDNVTYDYDNLYDEDYILKYSTYAALINKTAVCQGYSTLFYRLVLEAGIDTRVVSGVQISTNGDHSWNIVHLAHKYYDLDATWDAGRKNYSYFLKCDDDFENHARDAEYSTSEFNAEYNMSSENYGLSGEANIIAEGWCGTEEYHYKNLEWELGTDGTLTISGTGAMRDYYETEKAPWYEYKDSIKSLVFEEGITYIGEYAFSECSNITGKLVLPESLERIGWYAFQKCTGFTGDIIIPENVTSLGEWVFHKCTGFDGNLVIKGSITRIGAQAFYDCTGLKGSVVIPESVKTLGNWAFYNCGINEYYFSGNAPSVVAATEKFPSFDVSADTIYYDKETSGWELDKNGKWNGFNVSVPGGEDEESIVYGDVNGDGKVNIADANLARRASAKLITLDETQFRAADVNGDGKVNIVDANLIRRYAAKLIKTFPIEG